jgi:uncharacterized membrane protein
MASGILFVNLYSSLVDAQSWGSDMPHSIATAREYFKTTNPGSFFRIFSPINQLLGLVVLVLFWKSSPTIRLYLAAALIFYVLGDVLTFTYFYPRNEIMFETASLSDVNLLSKTWLEWSMMNWIRSLVIFTGLCFSFLSLHKVYLLPREEKSYAKQSHVS